MCARALFRGPGFIVTWADPDMLRRSACDPIGRPAREVYVGSKARETQRLMDEVYRTGQPVAFDLPSFDGTDGRLVIARTAEGVAVDWRPVPVRARSAGLRVSVGS